MDIGSAGRTWLTGLVAGLATIVALSGQGPGGGDDDLPSIPPLTGTVSITDEQATAILEAVDAPDGFSVSPFAGPPVANYPTCVTATYDGVVFVCVDRNGSLQADPGMGYIARLVDRDEDGRADGYSIFATMDSPRGAVFDGEWLYVSHPPFVTAHRDSDGDGVADQERTLVRGLGFDLSFRGADHTTNALEMGIDGWLYVAVGDYGAVKAVGADGREIQMRGGGNVRVRPDGSDLEIYARGTRNDYDLAIDPYLNLFARGNTNDGGGFDIRMYHFVQGMTVGYPALFLNFSDEVVPPIADYGTGSGTGMLYVHDAALPAPFGDTLLSVDWGRNAIFRHALAPKGATFSIGQEEFVNVPRPNDIAIDGMSRFYVASWAGGQFRYAGENVGFIARLVHDDARPVRLDDLTAAADGRLVEVIGSANLVHSRAAQAELLRRGSSPGRVAMLERLAGTGPLHGRVAAIFTLKQLAGAAATPALIALAADDDVRAFALRALADRRGELAGVPSALFVEALSATDPRVQLEAIAGLRRMGAVEAVPAILPLAASDDRLIANVATNALVALEAVGPLLEAVDAADNALAAAALAALQQIHRPGVVSGLIERTRNPVVSARRGAILAALARLANRDGVWRGTLAEWWGTRPDTTGPYYDPVGWEESARIVAVLTDAVLQTPASDVSSLLTTLEKNRVVPPGGAELLAALSSGGHADFDALSRALVGRVRLDVTGETASILARVSESGSDLRAAVAAMVVEAGAPTAEGAAILAAAAVDEAVPADTRAAALTSLASATTPGDRQRAAETFASLAAADSHGDAIEAAWTQFTTAPARAGDVPLMRDFVSSDDVNRQRLGYVVLLRLAAEPPAAGRGGRGRGGPSPQAVLAARTDAREIVEAGWTGPAAASLVWAVGRVGATEYADRVAGLRGGGDPAVREAATFTSERLAAAAVAAAPAPPAGPVVSSLAYEDIIERVEAMNGDVAAGRRVFEQQGCVACHTTAAGEQEKGPPLGGIRTRYSRAEVLESILRPNARVAQGFATNTFTMVDGRQIVGFVVREGQDDVVVRDLAGTETVLLKVQIANRGVLAESTMPPGLVDNVSIGDLASLLVFLESTSAN